MKKFVQNDVFYTLPLLKEKIFSTIAFSRA